MNATKKYTTIADLLADDGFLAWHLKANEMHELTWNKWIDEKPEHAALAKQAVQVLSVLTNPETEKKATQQINASFERLLKKIIKREKNLYNLL